MLETCSASTESALTTTVRVRQVIGLTTSTGDAGYAATDGNLSAAILAASRWAENYVGYPLLTQTYLETRPTYGRRTLALSRTPVRAVNRLFDSTDTGVASELGATDFRLEDREAGFLTRDDGWMWTVGYGIDLKPRPDAGDEYRPWMTEYVAGYTFGGLDTGSANWSTVMGTTSTGRTLPEDVEEAVAQKAANIYSGDDDAVSEKLGDISASYQRADGKTLEETLLMPYRRAV